MLSKPARLAGGIFILIALAGAIVWTVHSRTTSVPTFWVNREQVAYGNVVPGESLTAEFEIRNLGEGPLLISDLRSSCGCAPAQLTNSEIVPGGSALLTVSLHAPVDGSSMAHRISMKTNDPRQAEAAVRIVGQVQWPVETLPRAIYKTNVSRGATVTEELKIYSPSGAPFQVLKVQTSAPWIHVVPENTRASERAYLYRMELEGKVQGPFSEAIQITTTSERRPLIVIPVTGDVVQTQRIVPDRLILNSPIAGTTASVHLLLSSERDCPKVKALSLADSEWAVVRWNQRQLNAHTVLLEAWVRLPVASGYRRSTLSVTLTSRDLALTVPISGLILAEAKSK
jgi:hypothetical protein